MRTTSAFLSGLAAVASLLSPAFAQTAPKTFTHPDTGIVFNTWSASSSQTKGGFTLGMALPSNALTTDATEFIGYLECSSEKNGANSGWCGVSLRGAMTNNLLITAWPSDGEVYTNLMFATGYAMPKNYAGDAKITQIASSVNATHFTLVFRCQNCLSWDQDGVTGGISTSNKGAQLGWVQAFPSPGNPTCPTQITLSQHDNGMGQWGAAFDSNIANPSYTAWAAKATKTVTGSCSGPTTTSIAATPVPTGVSFDYIVVGGGAGGIPVADKLSESGKSVLLIEKGFASTGEHGGTLKPEWLQNTSLTRFDVPGLCNQIWVDSDGIACSDTDQMAGCVLGGGTAINAGLWYKPYTKDWDYLFPSGWKGSDIAGATSRALSRIPGTTTPSQDGKRYLQQGFEVLASGLKASGWKEVDSLKDSEQKNRTFSHTSYMYINGERGGPLATYLVSAKKRSNFKLWLNTAVKRVIREGGHITGVEVEAFRNGGYSGIIPVTNTTGRVVLSAGTFGSAKILLRSGIGPKDQLEVVKASADGPTMVSNSSWIDLPVGHNLVDHTNTDTVIQHNNVTFYDFYKAWDNPNTTDMNLYLNGRSGIFAQAAPNIGPLFWEEITGADGIVRQLHWTARVEGSFETPDGYAMTMSQYLGRGATSRGRMTLSPTLNTVVSDLPYLKDPNDKAAVVQGIVNLQKALANVKGLTWAYPSANQTAADFVDKQPVTYQSRRSNHWMGTNKMGTDDGRSGGTAVVDTNTRVYGTDNLYVVDASIFPGVPTTNPTAYIVVAAEHAAAKILAQPANEAVPRWGWCGGPTYTGSQTCQAPYKCEKQNDWYWQCV
ncbi:uncharacterized protein B0T23DRAFT_118243 [Neurospora hispaniola]|uniref:CBM1 domain-containing protein n=1 Tax=Neurospora hispaniola TaxID=588809 RepID=A0AAJ0IA44_9PEZI|nr:hypothetical protein B0T23DRAFT_118243 [Neurospora hispaniola]